MIRASSAAASSIWCVAMMMVLPAKRWAINSRKPRAASTSSAAIGSSKSSTSGSTTSARARAIRCAWPPDTCAGLRCSKLAKPTDSRASRARTSASSVEIPAQRKGKATLASTLIWGNKTGFCSKVAIFGWRPEAPSGHCQVQVICGASRTPESTDSNVLFPEPLCPINAVTAPPWQVRSTSIRRSGSFPAICTPGTGTRRCWPCASPFPFPRPWPGCVATREASEGTFASSRAAPLMRREYHHCEKAEAPPTKTSATNTKMTDSIRAISVDSSRWR